MDTNWEIGRDELICPYCGYTEPATFDMDWDTLEGEMYEEGEHEATCPNCDKVFKVTATIKWEYRTEEVELR